MKKTIVSIALLALVGTPSAIAQSGGAGTGGSSDASKGSLLQAPIGHRQPRASDVPNEKNLANPDDPLMKENAALDRRIKSICRGC